MHKIGPVRISFQFFQTERAEPNRSTNVTASIDRTEQGTRLDLYEVYEIGIALLVGSVKSIIRPSLDN